MVYNWMTNFYVVNFTKFIISDRDLIFIYCAITTMPSSTITVQVGQCGNQLGMAFWERMCQEHGITPEGQVNMESGGPKSDDCKEIFFYEANCGQKWVPRAVLVDLEPRVLSEICNYDLNQYSMLFDVDAIYQGPTGGGAGNNWACGFNQGADVLEQIMNIVEGEAEKADHLECFAICHSIMGGTGSGLGSRILQELRDRYGKKIIQTYSTLQPMTCNVQVAPYNIVLSLDTIMHHADMCLLFDNDAFEKQCKAVNPLQRFRSDTHEDLTNLGATEMKKNYCQINSMMSQVMTGLTAPIRFYSPVYSRIMHISAMLNPFPPMIFSQSAFVPHVPVRADGPKQQLIKYPDPRTVLSHLLDPRQLISSYSPILKRQKEEEIRQREEKEKRQKDPEKAAEREKQQKSPKPPLFTAEHQHRLISGLAILQSTEMDPLMKLAGSVAPAGAPISDLYEHIRMRNQTQKNIYRSPPWMPSSMNLTCCRLSPHMPHEQHPITGLLIANHTSVGVCLNAFGSHFEKMWKRKANAHAFEQSFVGNFEEKMDSSKANLDALLQLYKEACSESFMDFDLEQMQQSPQQQENITPTRSELHHQQFSPSSSALTSTPYLT